MRQIVVERYAAAAGMVNKRGSTGEVGVGFFLRVFFRDTGTGFPKVFSFGKSGFETRRTSVLRRPAREDSSKKSHRAATIRTLQCVQNS